MVNGAELLEAIKIISSEKEIDEKEIIEGIKEGFKKAFERFFDTEAIVETDVDLTTGTIAMFLDLKVVQQVEDDWLEIGINEAKEKFGDNVAIGDTVRKPIEFTNEFSRLGVHQVRQIIQQKIRNAERTRVYNKFIDKNHELLTGQIIGMNEQGTAYLVQLDGTVASLWSKKLIPGDDFKINDFVTFYVEDVEKDNRFSQIQASRTAPGFLAKVLEMEVPEVAEGIIEIMAGSREPGRRAKIAVKSIDENVEPIGAIVGQRGSRINKVSELLNGEKIDVVKWSDDLHEFIMNAMAPVRVVSVDVDEENNEADIIVPDEQLSLAIGKKGMAARLVANLIKMKINIISKTQAEELGIENKWNGNITQEELDSKEFLENTSKRRQRNNNFNNNDGEARYVRKQNDTFVDLAAELEKFQNELANDMEAEEYESKSAVIKEDIENVEEAIQETEESLDEIQANLKAFEELTSESEEDVDDEEEIIDDEFDEYYD